MKVIEFIVDRLEYLIAIGVFGYGVINESVFYVCVAIMMWIVYDTVDDWESKNKEGGNNWWNAEYKEPSSSEKPNRSEIPTSSDCVDRHAVDMLAYRYLKEPTDNHVAFYEDFLDLPSVTPIRPKGYWIKEKSVHGWDGRSYQCSVCGRSIHLDTAVEDIYDYPYCHCGAKMEEAKE